MPATSYCTDNLSASIQKQWTRSWNCSWQVPNDDIILYHCYSIPVMFIQRFPFTVKGLPNNCIPYSTVHVVTMNTAAPLKLVHYTGVLREGALDLWFNTGAYRGAYWSTSNCLEIVKVYWSWIAFVTAIKLRYATMRFSRVKYFRLINSGKFFAVKYFRGSFRHTKIFSVNNCNKEIMPIENFPDYGIRALT